MPAIAGQARRVLVACVPFLGYLAVSLLYWGWPLLPHPGRMLIGAPQQGDGEIFVWMFAWWPHALLHGLNPFYSHAVYAPSGVNLVWVTSVPALAIAFAPVTLLFGPVVGYDVAALVMPALAAFCAFRLCRALTASLLGALVGGFLFGFSSYMLNQQFAGHINLTSVFLVPLVPLVVLRYLRGELGRNAFVVRLGALLALQTYLSIEVLVTTTMMLVAGAALGFAIFPTWRQPLRRSLPALVTAYGLGLLLAAPLVYYAVTGFSRATVYANQFSADLANIVVPTENIAWGGHFAASWSALFPGDLAEHDSYIGIPVLVMLFLLLVRSRQRRLGLYLVVCFVVATAISFGDGLFVKGRQVAWLPWSLIAGWPVLSDVVASRIAIYATLAASVGAAVWIGSRRGTVFSRPYVLPVLAVAALLPTFWDSDSVEQPPRPVFFAAGLYHHCIARGSTVLIFPFGHWGDSLLWQAESGFWFSMAEGALGHDNQPTSFISDPVADELTYELLDPASRAPMSAVRGFVRRHGVTRVISVVDYNFYPDAYQLRQLGAISGIGGVLTSPPCS